MITGEEGDEVIDLLFAHINLTEIEDLMEDVGKKLITKDGQVVIEFYSLLYSFNFCYTLLRKILDKNRIRICWDKCLFFCV